jgi:hypothetical protein
MHSQQTPIPLDQLGAPARRALANAGYSTLEQLAGARESEVADLHGMGPNALEKLRRALSEHQLSFASED